MHRFHLPPEQCAGDSLTLSGREAHHALDVLRLKRGETVVVLDGAGAEIHGEVAEARRGEVRLKATHRVSVAPRPYQLTLFQAIPKGRILEAIIEKGTELGVHRIVPVLSERVITRLDTAAATVRTEKWRRTAVEAIKQCGAAWLPGIEPPATPAQILARNESFDLPLIASLLENRRQPREHFEHFRREHGLPPRRVCVWVGPEGDFTGGEIAAITAAGARPITLGPLVLRSETAALYCLSVLSHELQLDSSRQAEER